MRTILLSNQNLHELTRYISQNIANRKKFYEKRSQRKQSDSTHEELTPEQAEFKQKRAARVIQRWWRGLKIKQAIVESPYQAYLSLISHDDEQYLLSQIMFGRHAAELAKFSPDRTANPFIHEQAFYHRDDDLEGALLRDLLAEFKLSDENLRNYDIIPITLLESTPIKEVAQQYFPKGRDNNYNILIKPGHTIGLIAIPKANKHRARIKTVLRSTGLVASPWEIASNVKKVKHARPSSVDISIDPSLPRTKKALLNSKIYAKLCYISKSKRHTSRHLACCLVDMLNGLPELNQASLQRISLMLDMANTFYEHNYPRFAFCVYAITHEISLAFAEQGEDRDLKQGFNEFLQESKSSLATSLDLDIEEFQNALLFNM